MAVLDILQFGDDILREKSTEVADFNEEQSPQLTHFSRSMTGYAKPSASYSMCIAPFPQT